jgi:integrase
VLFELGINDLKIAAYLGHKNSDITRRVYAHLLSEDTTEVAEALSGADLVSSVLSAENRG